MSTVVLIHGAGDVGWSWHRVVAELESRGHVAVAPDLPCDDEAATLADHTDTVLAAVGPTEGPTVVVGHSLGGVVAPLVADALAAERLVLVAPVIPRPGERPLDWWGDVGYAEAVAAAAAADGGLTGHDDPLVAFLHDVEPALAAEALRRGRHQSMATLHEAWPGRDLRGRAEVVVCTADRFFPADLLRRVAAERVGTPVHEIDASHGVALSRPRELAALFCR